LHEDSILQQTDGKKIDEFKNLVIDTLSDNSNCYTVGGVRRQFECFLL